MRQLQALIQAVRQTSYVVRCDDSAVPCSPVFMDIASQSPAEQIPQVFLPLIRIRVELPIRASVAVITGPSAQWQSVDCPQEAVNVAGISMRAKYSAHYLLLSPRRCILPLPLHGEQALSGRLPESLPQTLLFIMPAR